MITINLHRPTRAYVIEHATFVTLAVEVEGGSEVAIYLTGMKAEAAKCIAEYFNDNLASPA